MSQKIKKNYYEILDVNPRSSREDIEEAFRRAKKLYSEGSDALYSLYAASEREDMLNQITEAYETLKDPSKRSSYDMLFGSGHGEGTYEVDINALRGGPEYYQRGINASGVFPNTVKLKKPLVVMDGNEPMAAEQYRILYTRIEHISARSCYKAFAITSAVKGEGKSITALNLSYLMSAEFKKRVVMLECDLRKPSSLLPFLENAEAEGLADVLRGEADLHTAVRRVEGTGLHVLPSGRHHGKSTELLGTPGVKNLICSLKTEFDYVIVDSPPVLPLVDMNIVSKFVDGVIMLVRAGKTPKDIVKKALESLNGANMVGIVLNGADTKLKKYYY